LRAIGKGHDNEMFVLFVDLVELGPNLEPLMRSVKVALARHHQVMVIIPWPPGLELPNREDPEGGPLARAVPRSPDRGTPPTEGHPEQRGDLRSRPGGWSGDQTPAQGDQAPAQKKKRKRFLADPAKEIDVGKLIRKMTAKRYVQS